MIILYKYQTDKQYIEYIGLTKDNKFTLLDKDKNQCWDKGFDTFDELAKFHGIDTKKLETC